MLLEGRVAIVTGAASERGIGRACARLFREHGARVALLDVDGEGAESAAATLGEGAAAWRCDVTDAARCRDVTAEVAEHFGGIDVVVGNAGVVYPTPLEDIMPEEYDQVLDVNLRGNFHVAQATVPWLRAARGGSMVFVSSIAGRSGGGFFGRSHYAAAKAGIFGLARALARELAPDGIRANAVAPGPVDNEFTAGRMTPEIKADIAKTIPLGRLAEPDDVAKACLFLASDLAAYVTGVVLDVNGGLLIH